MTEQEKYEHKLLLSLAACGLLTTSRELLEDLLDQNAMDLLILAREINMLAHSPRELCDQWEMSFTWQTLDFIAETLVMRAACPPVFHAGKLYTQLRCKLAEIARINCARLAHRALPF